MSRNVTLDFVRGAATLGILLLNINAFGLPKAAYLNPAWYGDITGRDAWTWAVIDLFAQVKFLTLFAMLFGAGLQMLFARGSRWIQTRLTLLALLGGAHAALLWDGDILLPYALVGLVVWRFIRDACTVHTLFNTGAMLYLIGIFVMLLLAWLADSDMNRAWVPDSVALDNETVWTLAGGREAIHYRLGLLSDNLLALGVQYGWQLAGMMFTGAALMRSGWLRGAFSQSHYRRCAVILIPLGMVINLPAIVAQWALDWDYRWCAFLLQIPRELGAPLQGLGYAALAWGFWPWLARFRVVMAVACVGRMALTNYLLQTLICTTLFSRFGLWMGFDRLSLLAFVPGVWTFNLLFSVLWLRVFRQGPIEWLWRQLTHLASGVPLHINK